jgi:hypothetical protein
MDADDRFHEIFGTIFSNLKLPGKRTKTGDFLHRSLLAFHARGLCLGARIALIFGGACHAQGIIDGAMAPPAAQVRH